MSRFEAQPHELLRPFVATYWGFAREYPKPERIAITPDCFVELLFFDAPPCVEAASGLRRMPACVVIPLLREPLQIVASGFVRCAAVRLHAWAAGIVVPGEMPSNAVWGDASPAFAPIASALAEPLAREDWTRVAIRLDAALLRVLRAAPAASEKTRIAVRALTSAPDQTDVASITKVAAGHGGSRRRLERAVRAATNHAPKQLASLRRFQCVRDTLWADPGADLRALALDAGYADQAHLSRQFRRYAGQSPTAFKRDCERLRASLRSEDVAIVQDSAHARGYDMQP
jgi:AraC-like DNA-binding protein